ncbi:MAG TPA: radical SAM protein [Armatimonadota bacterium]|nr:radical SAM protein [Armatimonadota bacterium]
MSEAASPRLRDRVFTSDEPPSTIDEWIVGQRGPRNRVDPDRVMDAFVEEERSESCELAPTATLFLTNRECPFRCLMCDLWMNTLTETVALGAIPRQIREALSRLPPARQIKLYNSGSFFDPHAIPPADDAEIANLLSPFERVIVECHPAFIGRRCFEFRDQLRAPLEVAIGLETAHPEALARLNKRMTLNDFTRAASRLVHAGIAVRAFILLRPPYLSEEEGRVWAMRSIDFAFDAGASVCTIIPTRAGNGALDTLVKLGDFSSPSLESLEAVVEYGVGLGRGRVFADLWDLERRAEPPLQPRLMRLRQINREQRIPPALLNPGHA